MSDARTQFEAIVKGPGKFEREEPWVPYFWSIYLDGGADEDDGGVLSFRVKLQDTLVFPELKSYTWIHLREDEQGFVREVMGSRQ